MARSASLSPAQLKKHNRQRIEAHRQRLAAAGTTQGQRSAARQREQLAQDAEAQRRAEERASASRRARREQNQKAGIAQKINAPFYARKLPNGTARSWGSRSNPIWVDSATASVLSHYNIALRELRAGNDGRIDEFIGRQIMDRDGNRYELVTNLAEINKLIEAHHRIDYVKNYRSEAA